MRNDDLDTRGVGVEGGRTTVALEPIFWNLLEQICTQRRTTLSALVQEIDSMRGDHPRASAMRVYVAKHFSALDEMRKPETLAPEDRKSVV